MSTKPENLFYKQIFRELKQVFWTRIENRHGGGIPDLYGVYNGFCFWLECKTIIKQNKINISPLQISWNYKNFQEIKDNYSSIETIQDLENNTSIIPVVGTDRLIIENF